MPRSTERKKRGRPRGTSNKAGKSVVNLPRRAKPRIGKKPAKISEYESDNGASSDEKKSSEMVDSKQRSGSNQPKRTQAQFRNTPSEIDGNELHGTLKDEFEVSKANEGPSKSSNLLLSNSGKEEVQKHYSLEKGKAVEQVEDSNFDEIHKAGNEPRSSAQQYNQETVDPVQAMLMTLIPSLATIKAESANSVPDVVKDGGSNANTGREEKRALDAETQPPVKKKKVSYKDIANELLKDW